MKHAYLVFASTFFLGVVMGSMVFFYTNTGNEGDGSLDTDAGYAVAVYMYGGCELIGCPSYRLSQDGEYIYIGGDGQRFQGTVSLRDRREVGDALSDAALTAKEASVFSGTCPAYVDGVAYRYEITYKGADYTFDSCVQAIDTEPLFQMLNGYIEIFEAQHYGA